MHPLVAWIDIERMDLAKGVGDEFKRAKTKPKHRVGGDVASVDEAICHLSLLNKI
jgi:hypothetical protein